MEAQKSHKLQDLFDSGVRNQYMDTNNIIEHLAKLHAMKEYIFVLDIVDDHMVPVVVAHAVLTAHKQFQDNREYRHWYGSSYKKCVCKVNATEMRKVLSTEKCFYNN